MGAFFNLMNFGQMLLWHIVLIPILLIALIGAHVLLVRMRGVSHPLPVTRPGGSPPGAPPKADRAAWRGPTRRYDILKEGTIATVVALILTVGLAGLLSSPDVPSVTVRSWVQVDPGGFLATAATELNETSGTPPSGRLTTTTPHRSGSCRPRRLGRSQAADRHGADLRARTADQRRGERPGAGAALATYQAAPPPRRTSGRPTTGRRSPR